MGPFCPASERSACALQSVHCVVPTQTYALGLTIARGLAIEQRGDRW